MTVEERLAALEARVNELEAKLAAAENVVAENKKNIESNKSSIAENKKNIATNKGLLARITESAMESHRPDVIAFLNDGVAGAEAAQSQVEAGEHISVREQAASDAADLAQAYLSDEQVLTDAAAMLVAAEQQMAEKAEEKAEAKKEAKAGAAEEEAESLLERMTHRNEEINQNTIDAWLDPVKR